MRNFTVDIGCVLRNYHPQSQGHSPTGMGITEMNWTAEQQREHRKLWVEALRSGKYPQGQRKLRTADGFCCLGVACEISGLGAWDATNDFKTVGGEYGSRVLPTLVRQWIGLSDAEGDAGNGVCLAALNDEGASFAELADVIEREPEGLLIDEVAS